MRADRFPPVIIRLVGRRGRTAPIASPEGDHMAVMKDAPGPDRVDAWLGRRTGRGGLRPRSAASLLVACWLVAVMLLGIIERIADPDTYHSIWLAWWWAIETVTTVGFGDVVPQSAGGKVVAAFMMLGGLAFLSIVTATITSAFVARRQATATARGEDPVMQKLE